MSTPASGQDAGNHQRKHSTPTAPTLPKPPRHAGHRLKTSRSERALPVNHGFPRAKRRRSQTKSLVSLHDCSWVVRRIGDRAQRGVESY